MWHTTPIQQVLDDLQTNIQTGLSEADATARLAKYGANRLQGKKKKSVVQLFIAQLRNWLIYVLLAAVVITLFMGEYVDAVIILLVVILNAVLGVVQEVKAGKAIEALQKMSSPKALLRRDGNVREEDAVVLVPGDIVILDAGRYVPADLRLVETAHLQAEESALTGESVPSEKDAEAVVVDAETPLGDRVNCAYMSTLITAGRGVGVVVSTGMNTEVGRIAHLINDEEDSKTPLEQRLDELGKMLGKLAIGICVFIFIISLLQGRNMAEMFLTSVSLAVASIPEGLTAIVAVVLSIGVTAMSKRNAIIKKLPAVETLGSVNIICSDKTGTLTQNKMTVTQCYTLEGVLAVDDDFETGLSPAVKLLAKAMVLCSDATNENGNATGDPTEIALLDLGDKAGINRKELQQQAIRKNEYAFDSDRKLMSVLIAEGAQYTVYTKGALGSMFGICTHVFQNGEVVPFTNNIQEQYRVAAESMSNDALRTLAVAFKNVAGYIETDEMENGLILMGMTGMIDPPRAEVKPSIQLAKDAGITTIMITGDHKNTAFAIAKNLGIAEDIHQAITGKELDAIPEAQLSDTIENIRVYARVSPEHKVKIVRGLKERGNVVSMTGDGVNDAPSLNAADIGVAMGITGTDVAKGAADMILTDDNFSTIVTAIEQGRNIFNNIRKAVIFLLSTNLGEVVTMFVCLMIGWQSPFIATQLLWINLLTDSLPAIALGMDPGDPDVMKERPRNPKESFFANGAGRHAIMGGILIGLISMIAFWYGYYEHGFRPKDTVPDHVLSYVRTMAFMTLVIAQLLYALGIRNHKKPLYKIGLFSNKYLIAAIVIGIVLQLLVLYVPVLRSAFRLQVLDAKGWIAALLLGLVPLAMVEIFKLFGRKKE